MQNLIVSESFGPIRRENLLEVQVNEVYHQEDLVEGLQGAGSRVFFFGYDDIMQLSRKQIIGHL